MIEVLIIDEENNYSQLVSYMGASRCRIVFQNNIFLRYSDFRYQYDVVIIDVINSKERKLELISKFREMNTDAMIIMISDSYDCANSLRVNSDNYLIKESPTVYEQIGNIINDLYLQKKEDIVDDKCAIYDLIQYITKNYHKKISLDSLSKISHFNPYYISSLFKKTTGMDLKDYIRDIRINKAKELLIDTNYNIGVVGTLVGYGEPVSFNRAFKRVVGFSPTQYREKVDRVI